MNFPLFLYKNIYPLFTLKNLLPLYIISSSLLNNLHTHARACTQLQNDVVFKGRDLEQEDNAHELQWQYFRGGTWFSNHKYMVEHAYVEHDITHFNITDKITLYINDCSKTTSKPPLPNKLATSDNDFKEFDTNLSKSIKAHSSSLSLYIGR